MGVIGGGMGKTHLASMHQVKDLQVNAFCDIRPAACKNISQQYQVKGFTDYKKMIDSKTIDAVLIATPHYSHPDIALYAFKKDIHVLCEKPVAVHVKDARKMNQAHKKSKSVFGIMFQYRTQPYYKKAKELVESGELGKLVRVTMMCTHCFRTQRYYDSGTWRATWAGEGGGVLLNQTPHFLDILQWITGMPQKVHGHCYLGKHHNIAVEDDVTAFMEYKNGATGLFITSTGEAPGTNMFEICGDRGKLVVADTKLTFHRTRVPVNKFCRETNEKWASPETWKAEIPVRSAPSGHWVITQNFVNAILHQETLISPGIEGLNSLELGNAMLYSSLTGQPASLPLDGDAYEALLNDLIKKEKTRRKKYKEGVFEK